jgi:hypothetical protein
MPNLNEDYDVIGFDADHCLVKYDIVELTKLIVDTHLKRLTEDYEGYPKEICNFDYAKNSGTVLNNATWDIQNGNVLKLG